jgi:hypothetical protein
MAKLPKRWWRQTPQHRHDKDQRATTIVLSAIILLLIGLILIVLALRGVR